jgi:hypothetical protein
VFVPLAIYTYHQQPAAIWALAIVAAASFVIEAVYRKLTGRTIRLDM